MPSSSRIRLSNARTERPLEESAWIRVFTLRVVLRVRTGMSVANDSRIKRVDDAVGIEK
jgi:hypothetical protein